MVCLFALAGKTVAMVNKAGFDGDCKRKVAVRETINGLRFDPNDYMIAIQWYHRLNEDSARQTFVQTQLVGVVMQNSASLRLVGPEFMELLEGEPLLAQRSRRSGTRGGVVEREVENERHRKYFWPSAVLEIALSECM